jgi:hypothetical protein
MHPVKPKLSLAEIMRSSGGDREEIKSVHLCPGASIFWLATAANIVAALGIGTLGVFLSWERT